MSKIDLYPTLGASPQAAKVATGTAVSGDKFALDVSIAGSTGSITGEFTPTGLKVEGKVTTMLVTDTVTAIPLLPLSERNSISLTNLSTIDTLYVGFHTGITADQALGTTAGWEVGPQEGFNLDIQDDVILYGITETGKTIKIKVMELA